MRFISSLLVVAALVGGQAMADDDDYVYEQVQLQPDGSLVAHPEPAQTISTEDIKAHLDEFEFDEGERRSTPISEVVAHLLYTAEDKSAEVINGLTVNELIAENSFHPLADCSEEALAKRAEIYYASMPKGEGSSGAPFAVTVYSLKCLMMAANYCITHRDEVIQAGKASDKFMEHLYQAYVWDNRYGEVASEDSLQAEVHYGIESSVPIFLMLNMDATKRLESN